MLLSNKLKNAIQLLNFDLVCSLKNISINGSKRGCSGFVTNPTTGKVIYVNTEESCYSPLNGKALWRFAKNTKDYTGEHNQFCATNELAKVVVNALA